MAKSPTPPGDLDPFRESMKIFSDMRFGAMPDLEGLAAAQRRNLEALSARTAWRSRVPRPWPSGTWRSCSSPWPR